MPLTRGVWPLFSEARVYLKSYESAPSEPVNGAPRFAYAAKNVARLCPQYHDATATAKRTQPGGDEADTGYKWDLREFAEKGFKIGDRGRGSCLETY